MTPGSTDASAVPVPPAILETTCVPPLPSARAEAAPPRPTSPADPELRWRQAGRALLAKTIAEFAYEDLLAPVPEPEGWHRLDLPAAGPGDQPVEYRFRADRGAYGSWFVDPGSVRRGGHPATDPLGFVADAADALGLPGDTAGHLVREMAATLAADAQILATATLTAAELADLDYAQLEGHQTGHPWIAFNKGRMGFSAADALRHAPEARQPVRLPWIAVRDDLARYQAVDGLGARRLYTEELSPAVRVRFGAELIRHNCNPARYWWLPIHPWQWDETIQPLYGAEIAASRLVYLGEGDDSYLPQQSIRTFSNISAPHRRHVKLPLSVLNTMVWRGLPTERTSAAPAVTAWLKGVAAADPFLTDVCKVVLLGEVASVTVEHPVLDRMIGVPYQYRELLGAIWREPLPAALQPGERGRTLAALLSFGADGRPLIAELVARSGLAGREWLERLFAAILPPLLRFLYAHGTAFSPHGENAVVIYDERDVPARLAVKDFVDDVNLAAADLPELEDLPEAVAAVLLREKPDYLCQFLHSGLFIGHFRYLARISEIYLEVPAAEFWAQVRATIAGYQEQFPDHADRYELFDLGTRRIARLCLNRNRLLLDGYRDRPERPHVAAFGEVSNPLAPTRAD
ncbi:MAG TPA: IucA/IucC family siderophore biosynthesis protein [Actinocrinis sp.]|nr:IucA/IucC family siderophore biosynthesis protein [Actinocrinis sp.]